MRWDKTIYDKDLHLFYIGPAEIPFYEPNIGHWIDRGIIPLHPSDTSALKISAYGTQGPEQFELGAAEMRTTGNIDN